MDDQNTFTEIYNAFLYNNPGAIPVVLVALGILIFLSAHGSKAIGFWVSYPVHCGR
jgi:hypothetical protein